MTRDRRRERFSALLDALMERAEVGDTELGNRMDVSRVTVHRWRTGESLPREDTVRQLKRELRWVDASGVVRELEEAELEELLVAAGYHTAPSHFGADRSEGAERCTVYSTRPDSNRFPSAWCRRIIDLERAIPGEIYAMSRGLPSITRSPDFYRGAYTEAGYDREQVEAYLALHEARQTAFLERLGTAEVHHLYSTRGVEALLSDAGWRAWNAPREALAEQLERTIGWLEDHENFEVRLRSDVPSEVTIIGHEVVLVSVSATSSPVRAERVSGLELVGAAAAAQFTRQFRGLWADRDTMKDRQDVIGWLRERHERMLRDG